MKKFLILLIFPLFLTACNIRPVNNSALKVTSDPQASVFLNGEKIGSTPFYSEDLKKGDYTIKLMPENGIGLPWESQIKLSPGISTVVSRKLGQNLEDSSGYTIFLEKMISDEDAKIAIVSEPENAVIKVNGEAKGFSPLETSNMEEGEYSIQISSPGYVDRTLKANLVYGYKLILSVNLSKTENYEEDSQEKPEEENELKGNRGETEEETEKEEVLDSEIEDEEKELEEETENVGKDLKAPFVTILDTPTGWLNVREEPSTASEIVKKAKPGDQYKYIDLNEVGWYKIEIKDGEVAWISSKYAKLTKED